MPAETCTVLDQARNQSYSKVAFTLEPGCTARSQRRLRPRKAHTKPMSPCLEETDGFPTFACKSNNALADANSSEEQHSNSSGSLAGAAIFRTKSLARSPPSRRKTGRPIMWDADPDAPGLNGEERKLLKRRKNNREYARNCRMRKEKELKRLQDEVKNIVEENKSVAKQMEADTIEVEKLHLQMMMMTNELSALTDQQTTLKELWQHITARTISMMRSAAECDKVGAASPVRCRPVDPDNAHSPQTPTSRLASDWGVEHGNSNLNELCSWRKPNWRKNSYSGYPSSDIVMSSGADRFSRAVLKQEA